MKKMIVSFVLMLMVAYVFSQALTMQGEKEGDRDPVRSIYTFTNCGQTGRTGPSQAQVNFAYSGTTLDGNVTSNSGIQEWIVPEAGIYKIEAFGATGGNAGGHLGGAGVKMEGIFHLVNENVLKILVGQKGIEGLILYNGEAQQSGGTGGGGTFVIASPYTTNESILLIAGGGGGASRAGIGGGYNSNGQDATINQDGLTGGNSNTGGSVGTGGLSESWTGWHGGTGGAGFLGDGVNTSAGYAGYGTVNHPGLSFQNNGLGGDPGSDGRAGGFGGGGAAGFTGGGGGGYSGGGAGENPEPVGAGGGGSYNSGTNQDNQAGVNSDHGYVIITYLGGDVTADFTVNETNIVFNTELQFTDTSSGNPTSWEWDFENNGTIDSELQNPLWTYNTPGIYSVSLTISTVDSIDTETKIDYITVTPYPNPTIEIQPESLEFGNVCINETAIIPIYVHNYGQTDLIVTNIMSSTNRFSVSLPQRDINFTIASMDSQLVNVSFSPNALEETTGSLYFLSNDPDNSMLSYPVSGTGYNFEAGFTVDITNGDAPLEVHFTDTSIGDIQNWNWDFGDGNSSILQNPNHIYETDGIYSVTLNVEDDYHQKSLTQENLITVIGHPILSSPDSLGINFGSLYLTDSSGDSLIVIRNIGTKAFQIDALTFVEDTGGFNFTYQNMGVPILPTESDTILVNFYPSATGSFNDHILINNTSENHPNYEINLYGFCDYAPPTAPDTVYIEIIESDAIVSWEPVTENIYGAPLTPDGYLLFFSADPGEEDDNYFFLAFTTELTHTHEYVVEYSPQMFYKVLATVNLTRAEFEYFSSLNNLREKVKWSEVKRNIETKK